MSFTEHFENNKNNNSIEYSIEPKFLALLNKTTNFYVLKPEIRFLPDTEKLIHSIKINKKSFEKIFSLNQTNFIEILSFTEIVISKLRYEYFHSLLLSRSKSEPRLKRLLKNIESFSMNGNTIISKYSIKKILRLGGFDERDLASYMNIKKLAYLTSKEGKMREKKIKKLSNKTKRMKLNDINNDWGNLKYKIIERDDKSKKFEIQHINEIDNQFQDILKIYNKIKEDIENRKNFFYNEMENQRKIFVSVEDNEGNKEYIRKDYIELIKENNNINKKNKKIQFKDLFINYSNNDNTSESSNEDNYYEIKNCNNEIIFIPKEKLDNYIYDKDDELFFIQSNNDLPTLTSKIRIKEALENWKNLNQISNIPSRYPKNRWRKVQLINMNFPEQNEINQLPSKDDIEKIKLKQKNELLNELNNESNFLFEIKNNQLINLNVINEIINDSNQYDDYKVQNFLNHKSIDVSKKEIEDIIDEDKYYIKLIDKSTGLNHIINRNDLLEKIENNSNMREHIFLKNYKGKNLIIKPKDILIEKMNENEKPYQIQKGEIINKKLEKDIKNTIIFKQIDNFLIPQQLLDNIRNDESEINEFEVPAIESYSDDIYNPSSKTIINKEDIETIEQFPEFIEIIYNDGNEEKRNLVNKKDLLNGINDNTKDEIILNDFIGNEINTKKSNIKINDNKNKNNIFFMDRSAKDYADDLLRNASENIIYQLIKDENNKWHLCNKSYINLVLQYNPINPFDKYVIPDINDEVITISKSKIENMKNREKYIKLINKNNNEENLLLLDDLINEHKEFSNENYLFSIYGKEKKIPIKVKDLEISNDNKKILFLPPQPEEAIANMKARLNDPKKDINIIQVYDINNEPFLVFKSKIHRKKIKYKHNKKDFVNKQSIGNNYNNINNINNEILKKSILKKKNTNYNDKNINETLIVKDIHGSKKEIKISSIPKKKANVEIYCMIIKGDEEILVNKKDLENLLTGGKSDIEHLIEDWLKKEPKKIDLLNINKKIKNHQDSNNNNINSISLNEKKKNEKVYKKIYKSHLELIKEEEKSEEEDEKNNNEKKEKKEKKVRKEKKEKKIKKDKLNKGYISAPENENNITKYLNIDEKNDDNMYYNDNKKSNELDEVKKKSKRKLYKRREIRSKSVNSKKLNSDIEYMISRRKDKDIYNIRWKIVRQFVKRIKKINK